MTFDQFSRVLTDGKRADGQDVLMPMSLMTPYGKNMTDTERKALYAYLQSLPPVPNGQ